MSALATDKLEGRHWFIFSTKKKVLAVSPQKATPGVVFSPEDIFAFEAIHKSFVCRITGCETSSLWQNEICSPKCFSHKSSPSEVDSSFIGVSDRRLFVLVTTLMCIIKLLDITQLVCSRQLASGRASVPASPEILTFHVPNYLENAAEDSIANIISSFSWSNIFQIY